MTQYKKGFHFLNHNALSLDKYLYCRLFCYFLVKNFFQQHILRQCRLIVSPFLTQIPKIAFIFFTKYILHHFVIWSWTSLSSIPLETTSIFWYRLWKLQGLFLCLSLLVSTRFVIIKLNFRYGNKETFFSTKV